MIYLIIRLNKSYKIMEKIECNLNQNQIIISQREISSHLSFKKKNSSFDKEKKILFNHKSSLEELLSIIKNSQLEYLLKSNKKKQMIKQILISLKNNLDLMLQEKNKKSNYLKKQNKEYKKKLQNIVFPSSKYLKKNKYNLKLNYNYYNNKVKSTIYEKNQLELLNFLIENEIEKTNFFIEQKIEINSFLHSYPFFSEIIQTFYCNNKYANINKVSDLLKEIIRNVRKEFIYTAKKEMTKKSEIEEISFQIENIKDIIEDYKLNGCKKYIETKDIIQEDSKECSETTIITNHSKRDLFLSYDNNKVKDNINFVYLKNENNANNQKERKIDDIFHNNFPLHKIKINKDIFNDRNKNNYLNMNINVNININNNNYIRKIYLDKNNKDENNEETEQYEMELNEKKRLL